MRRWFWWAVLGFGMGQSFFGNASAQVTQPAAAPGSGQPEAPRYSQPAVQPYSQLAGQPSPPSTAQPGAQANPQPATQPYSQPTVQPYPGDGTYPQTVVQPVIIMQMPEPPPSRAWADRRFGFELTLGGPNGQFGGGFATQLNRYLELAAWGSYAHASASGHTAQAYADADISVVTGMARARLWPLERHSVVVDTGLGFTNYSISANGVDYFDSTDSLHYKRNGTPGIANIGVGYGYRSNAEFRIAIIIGAMVQTNKLATGTVTSTGTFSAADRERLREELDTTTDKLTKVRAYIDVSIGFLF